MRRSVLAAVSVAAMGLTPVVAAPAQAVNATTRTVSTTDPSGDVDSRLDVVFSRFRGNGDGTATLTIRTAKSWGCRYLRDDVSEPQDQTHAALVWDFDRGADGTYETVGRFGCDQGRMHLELRRGGFEGTNFAARRPSARSVRVTIPLSELSGRHLNMRVISRVSGVDGDNVFFDEEDLVSTLRAY